MDCIFCAIVSGSAPAAVVHETKTTLAFLDIAPFAHGHTLVIPKLHTEDFWSISQEAAQEVMAAAHEVSALLRNHLSPDGMNLLQATRAPAFQTVFHMHLHVIPRWIGDTMALPPWPKPPADPTELAALADEIRTGTLPL
jgi:histidine triad (HIT) family protein